MTKSKRSLAGQPGKTLVAGALFAALLAFAGCAKGPIGDAESPPNKVDESTQSIPDVLWQRVQDQYPDAVRPPVDLVREVDKTEWASVVADCLTKAGFEAEAKANGLLAVSAGGTAQDMAQAIAEWSCTVQYPLEAKYTQPFTEVQLEALYEYQTTTLTTCLHEAGVEVSAAPSLQVYTQTWYSGEQWSPYRDVAHSGLSIEEIYALGGRCPELPEHVYDIG